MADAMMTTMMRTIIHEADPTAIIRPSLILTATPETKARRTIIKVNQEVMVLSLTVPSLISMIMRASLTTLVHHPSQSRLMAGAEAASILVNTTRISLLLDPQVRWWVQMATFLAHAYKKSNPWIRRY